jgi:threonine dehydratase
MNQPLPLSLSDIHQAAARLAGHVVRTPLLESPALNAHCGGRVLVKPEVLQHTGSFKFRGALNKLLSLNDAQRAAGVLAFSSGNHAQGVARAAQLLGIAATIVMPADAPRIKVQRTREYGARVVLYDRLKDDREAIARALASESGAVTIHPFDDSLVMAGQGTAGLEIGEQAPTGTIDLLLSPCGGGGLIAGIGTALLAYSPELEIHAVEPLAFNDTARSLALGTRVSNPPDSRSICDALLSPTPGALTFAVNQHNRLGGLAVTDAEVKQAIVFAFEHLKLVVEPGGAVALAALLSGRLKLDGRTAAVVLSGGNVDPQSYADYLSA